MNNEERLHLQEKILTSRGLALIDTALLDSRIATKHDYKEVYETMVFRIKQGRVEYGDELDCVMSYTEEDARAAHQSIVEKWRI